MKQLRKPFQHTQTLVIKEAREQTQEDIICFIDSFGFLSHSEFLKENLCQIVVDNFKKLEDKEYEIYQGQRDGKYWITDGEGNPDGPYDSIEDAQKNIDDATQST
tara:strand:+ start:6738 stop:7052 length:315 start_codon:yes stop_codon:yes gene_type:complete